MRPRAAKEVEMSWFRSNIPLSFYKPSHPSQKMRNVQKGRNQARTSSFTGTAKAAR